MEIKDKLIGYCCCSKCDKEAIVNVGKLVRYDYQNEMYEYECPHCGNTGLVLPQNVRTAEVTSYPIITDPDKIIVDKCSYYNVESEIEILKNITVPKLKSIIHKLSQAPKMLTEEELELIQDIIDTRGDKNDK